MAARGIYVLGIGHLVALAKSVIQREQCGSQRPHPSWTHINSEHLVYVGIHGHSLIIRLLLPTVPIAEWLEGIVDEL